MTKNNSKYKTEFIQKADEEEILIESVEDFGGAHGGSYFFKTNRIKLLNLTKCQMSSMKMRFIS